LVLGYPALRMAGQLQMRDRIVSAFGSQLRSSRKSVTVQHSCR
jgi:hypothetical protein